MNIEKQLKIILAKFNWEDICSNKSTKDDLLSGIHDGRLYDRISHNNIADGFSKKSAMTFLLNTDGISICNKSKLTIWPVYLVINELPAGKRYLVENVILAGLSIGDEKPHFDLLLKPIVSQLIRFQYGIVLKFADIITNVKFFLIAGVYDKPARYALINMIQFNGDYGCTKCLQKGESLKTDSGGYSHVYPFQENDPTGPNRTHEEYLDHLKVAQLNNHNEYGVKGACILSCLKFYKPVSSTCIDYMHSLLEGVVKRLFHHWFDSSYSSKSYSLRKYMQEVDLRLSLIKPPKFVPRTPRSIYNYSLWHANEYLAFIIYYSLPVLDQILPKEHFNNLEKLVVFVETLLDSDLSKKRLYDAKQVIQECVCEFEDLYGKEFMLSGSHELLHLVDETLDFGPLNLINCFQFEELNRKLTRFIHGFDLIGEELIKIFQTAQLLSNYSENILNDSLNSYVQDRINLKSSNAKNSRKNNNTAYVKSRFEVTTEEKYVKLVSDLCGKNIKIVKKGDKIVFNSVYYSSYSTKTKRCDACFIAKNGKCGLVEDILIVDDYVIVYARKLVRLMQPFYSPNYPNLRSKLEMCNISNENFVVFIQHIKKVFFIDLNNAGVFMSSFSSTHLFS
jgi:hypothetical protein